MWGEAGPPPDLATRLFTERIMFLVSCEGDVTCRDTCMLTLEAAGNAH